MPIHNWKRAYAGLFHHFHHNWITHLSNSLNAGRLPKGFFALAEQYARGPYPDVLTLERDPERENPKRGGAALVETPPRTRFQMRCDVDGYAARASLIAIHHVLGEIVAVIEIVSPGNKANLDNLRRFVRKTVKFIRKGVHVLVIDLFPPSKRDPQGIHKLIWDRFVEEPFQLPTDKTLTLASYSAGETKEAFVEPVAVGDALPDMPLFLEPGSHVLVPLDATYMQTWQECPEEFQQAVLDQTSG